MGCGTGLRGSPPTIDTTRAGALRPALCNT